MPELIDTVQLVVSELVTNAVLRSRTEVELRLERRPDRLRVAVRDDAVMYNLRRHREVEHVVAQGVAELEDNGRGLLLVKTMATSVGVNRHPAAARSPGRWCRSHQGHPTSTGPDMTITAPWCRLRGAATGGAYPCRIPELGNVL